MQRGYLPKDEMLVPLPSEVALSELYADPETWSKQVLKTGVVDGVVTNLFPSWSFGYLSGAIGLVQNFIRVDEVAQKFGDAVWHYKITAWNDQVKTLNLI